MKVYGGGWEGEMAVVVDPPLARLPDPVPAMLTTTLRLDRRRQRGQDEQGGGRGTDAG